MTRRALIGSIALIAVVVTGCLAVDDQTTTSPADSVPDQARAPESSTSSAPVATTITSSTSTTTTVPTTTTAPTTTTTATTTTVMITTTTLVDIGALEAGLFCRDIAGLGYDYSAAVAYWTREGRPDRMDADRNGIPCETVYDSAMVVAFWGDPLPTTTTPASTVWYRVVTPEYQVPSLPGAGSLYGSGCSPGSDRLPDGIWFGYIDRADNSAIEFDLMCFGPGPEGPGDITNSNPKLRTVPVAEGATVHRIMADAVLVWAAIAYPTWLATPPDPAVCPPEGCRLVWLYVNEGHVTEVVELFFS